MHDQAYWAHSIILKSLPEAFAIVYCYTDRFDTIFRRYTASWLVHGIWLNPKIYFIFNLCLFSFLQNIFPWMVRFLKVVNDTRPLEIQKYFIVVIKSRLLQTIIETQKHDLVK